MEPMIRDWIFYLLHYAAVLINSTYYAQYYAQYYAHVKICA